MLAFPFLLARNEPEFNLAASRFGSAKRESTSRKRMHRLTRSPNVFTVETNYWGSRSDAKELRRSRLIQHNLRVVRDFSGFYGTQDFRRIGGNLARSVVEFAERGGATDAATEKAMERYYAKHKQRGKKRLLLHKKKKDSGKIF